MSLAYEPAYHLHSNITLECGRTITLESLKQFVTYEGLLEGAPFKEMNDNYIDTTRELIQKDLPKHSNLYLVLPERRDYLRQPGDMKDQQRYVPHKIEWLPLITSVGRFTSLGITKDNKIIHTALTLLWFQDDFGMGLSEHTLQCIRAMNWDRFAAVYELD